MTSRDAVRALGSIGGCALLAGCVYRTPPVHLPEAVSRGEARLEIGTVRVLEDGADADAGTVEEFQALASDLFLRASSPDPSAPKLRTDVRVWLVARSGIEDAMRQDGFAGMAYVGAPFGLMLWDETLVVEVVVHRDGASFIGFGIGDRSGGVYAPARRRALADGLDHAFADAAQKAKAP